MPGHRRLILALPLAIGALALGGCKKSAPPPPQSDATTPAPSAPAPAAFEVKTIEVGKRNVKYHAARSKHSWVGEEFLCGREDFRLPACETDQQFQRFAHGDVVVNNKNDWLILRLR